MYGSIISDIVHEAETLIQDGEVVWAKVQASITGEAAKAKAAFPAAATAIDATASDVKQGASDAIGMGSAILGDAQPAIVSGTEAAADAALLKLTGGLATPLLPGVNGWIGGIVSTGIAALQAWGLRQQAGLAPAVSQVQSGAALPQPQSGSQVTPPSGAQLAGG